MKKVRICCGVMVWSVLSNAWGGNSPLGSLSKSQRMGTGGKARFPVAYHAFIVSSCQRVLGIL